MKAPFKYFVKVTKAYEENDSWYVAGIASGTLEDRDEERMSEQVLYDFASAIPLPLTNSHPRPGDVLGTLGEVVEASVIDEDNKSLYVKAKLDKSNPASGYAYQQILDGKRMAFSIEGDAPIVKPVWSEKLGKMINEFVRIIPRAISLTTEPSYSPSFATAVAKSYNNLLIKSSTMDEKEITQTEPVLVEATPIEAVEEVTQPAEPTPVVETEDVKPMEALEEVAKSAKKASKPESEESPTEPDTDEDADDSAKSQKAKKSSDDSMGDMVKTMKSMIEKMDAMMARMDSTEKSTKKNFNTVATVLKSVHDEMEVIKDLPLQKRSVVAKSLEDRVASTPKTAQDMIKNVLAETLNIK
jgi:hypothetical protein